MMNRLRGVITAMCTPFDEDGRVDLDGARRLAAYLLEHGSHGLVVAGTISARALQLVQIVLGRGIGIAHLVELRDELEADSGELVLGPFRTSGHGDGCGGGGGDRCGGCDGHGASIPRGGGLFHRTR